MSPRRWTHFWGGMMGLWFVGCSAQMEIETLPVSVLLPVTSLGQPVYAEVAVDIPPAALSPEVQIEEVWADGTLVNRAPESTLSVSLRVALQGTATPGAPVFFTDANRPVSFANAVLVLPDTLLPPSAQRPLNLTGGRLATLARQPRVWLIVSDTVTYRGPDDPFLLELDINNAILHARLSKSFAGLAPALEGSGL